MDDIKIYSFKNNERAYHHCSLMDLLKYSNITSIKIRDIYDLDPQLLVDIRKSTSLVSLKFICCSFINFEYMFY